ncbi:MAG: alpha/beta hydrolase [Fimbriimonadaceae bacterium]|nr:alpha/beta hydrolase [Alphaproteobacteria bacterium]
MYVAAGKLSGKKLADICEANYNNRKLVPDHGDEIANWQNDAAAYRRNSECAEDIVYMEESDGGSARTALDIFWPANTDREQCPIAMFIHGGYWQAMDRKLFSHLARGLNLRGVAVAMPSYDLCPDATIGRITDQVAAACVWLWRRYGRRIAVGGHSAGGHLTAAMMVHDFVALGAPADMVTNGLPISGIFDLRDLVHSSINEKVGMTLEEAARWSPLLATPPNAGLLHAWVGGDESEAFHWQNRAIVRVWRKAGVTTSAHTAKGANHFTVLRALTDPNSKMTENFAELAMAALA